MNCQEFDDQIDDFVDGLLPEFERRRFENHLEACSTCRQELESLRDLVSEVGSLPKSLLPARDLWPAIAGRVATSRQSTEGPLLDSRGSDALDGANANQPSRDCQVAAPVGNRTTRLRLGAAAAVLLIITGGILFWVARGTSSWDVLSLDGAPRVGSSVITDSGRLSVGEWLETDAVSRARIRVGKIGQVEVAPNSRVKLLEAELTEHRLALDRGAIEATIWAPPRLFFVETPSALAVDLGCAYQLKVDDDGAGLLQVTAGWVSLEYGGRKSYVPAGALCATEPGIGPGTPYFADAPDEFQTALMQLDFSGGGSEALSRLLPVSRRRDLLTLWHLLSRLPENDRALVYDRMAALSAPPAGTTRDGILRLEKGMLERWKDYLEPSFW